MSLPPEVLETYEVLGRIREGGMGAVYKVRHRRLGALRVVKILHAEDRADPDLIARFAREARLGGELSHPNLSQIHDVSEDYTWAVMEYIDGVPLDELLRTDGPLPTGLAVERWPRPGRPGSIPGSKTGSRWRASRSLRLRSSRCRCSSRWIKSNRPR